MTTMKNPELQAFLDEISKLATGMTAKQAQEQRICIQCRHPIAAHAPSSEAGLREYAISGIYGNECWLAACGPEEEE